MVSGAMRWPPDRLPVETKSGAASVGRSALAFKYSRIACSTSGASGILWSGSVRPFPQTYRTAPPSFISMSLIFALLNSIVRKPALTAKTYIASRRLPCSVARCTRPAGSFSLSACAAALAAVCAVMLSSMAKTCAGVNASFLWLVRSTFGACMFAAISG